MFVIYNPETQQYAVADEGGLSWTSCSCGASKWDDAEIAEEYCEENGLDPVWVKAL